MIYNIGCITLSACPTCFELVTSTVEGPGVRKNANSHTTQLYERHTPLISASAFALNLFLRAHRVLPLIWSFCVHFLSNTSQQKHFSKWVKFWFENSTFVSLSPPYSVLSPFPCDVLWLLCWVGRRLLWNSFWPPLWHTQGIKLLNYAKFIQILDIPLTHSRYQIIKWYLEIWICDTPLKHSR